MAKSTHTTLSLVERIYRFPLHSGMLCNHHLTNTFSVLYGKIDIRKIDQNHPYFTPIIGIDSSGSIHYSNTMLDSQATWPSFG